MSNPNVWFGQHDWMFVTSCKRECRIFVTAEAGGPAHKGGMKIGIGKPWIKFDDEKDWYPLDRYSMRHVDISKMTKWQLIFDKGNCHQWHSLHNMLYRLEIAASVIPYG